jgi:hypothetical protein
MQILRHSQIAMTMEVYSEVPTAKTRTALKRLGQATRWLVSSSGTRAAWQFR